MQHDDIIWNCLKQDFCSFRVKTEHHLFCRNEYNLTGLCKRTSCPLANGRFATVREVDGRLMLCIKTVERAHSPRDMWDQVELNRKSLRVALQEVDDNLQWWPKHLIYACKLRVIRLKQYLMKCRKYQLDNPVRIERINKKEERALLKREARAEKFARIDVEIEKELLDRLRSGRYDSMVNIAKDHFERLINQELDEEEEENENENEGDAEGRREKRVRDLEDEYHEVYGELEDEDEVEIEQEDREEQQAKRLKAMERNQRQAKADANRAPKKPRVEIEKETVSDLRSLLDW
eukprot:TRINITY_DN3573_c0_g1_i1.p1 TRINITY_DN3573_c0_g1~~TRINITY_DN3573_c0_g1_i1.p1  ORF type:complete len:292 (+),score=102.83 TRINITY_DN3573_c0_g1_i1:238-1113(+)